MNIQNNKKTNIVIINKTGSFNLLKRPEILKEGPQPGVIYDVFNYTGTENGAAFNRVDIAVKFDALNIKGENFLLSRTYNIAEEGRGIAMFLKDCNAIINADLTRTDLYEFEPASLIGKRVMVNVAYSKNGSEVISVIKSFVPQQPDDEFQTATIESAAALTLEPTMA